jgi:type II secretory pathway component PulF
MENYCSERKNPVDESNMWRMLGTAMSCGVPIIHSIKIIGENFHAYRDIMENSDRVIRNGENFSLGLTPFKNSLDGETLELIAQGEDHEELPASLISGADYIKNNLGIVSEEQRIAFLGFPNLCEQPDLTNLKVPVWANRLRLTKKDQPTTQEIATVVEAAELEARLKAGAIYGVYNQAQVNQIMFYDLLSRTLEHMHQESALKILSDSHITSYPLFITLRNISEKLPSPKSTLYDEIKKYPGQFSDFEAQIIKAGEIGGVLDQTSKRLSDYFQEAYELVNTARLIGFKG